MYISTAETVKIIKNCLELVPEKPTQEELCLYYGMLYGSLRTLNNILNEENINNE